MLPLVGCTSETVNNNTVDQGATCPDTGQPLDHAGVLDADESWGPGLHTVSYHLSVGDGVTLTIEPCATVRLDADVTIEVDGQASLVAVGTSSQPIVFERSGADAWGSIAAFAPASVQLENVTLRGGGTTSPPANATYAGATLVGRNQTTTPRDTLRVQDVVVEDSNGLGVMLQGGGFVEGSVALTVTGAGLNPVYLGAGHATNLPDGVYTGNGDDEFLLQSVGPAVYDNNGPILQDATLPNRGLPYLVGFEGTFPSIVVGDGREESPGATLTIEPGVELRFQGRETTSTQLRVRGKPSGDSWTPQGALVAVGTEDAPIVLTSAEDTPQAGDWQGLYFEYVVSPLTTVSHVQVSYAGGESTATGYCVASMGAANNDADCSTILFLDVPPTSAFITNSAFDHGAGCGIYRGWSGAEVDFSATNSFADLAGCNQSNVHNDMDGCVGPCQ